MLEFVKGGFKMLRRKKIYSLLTAVCLFAAVLSGCTGKEKETIGQNQGTSSVQTESQSTVGAQTGDAVGNPFCLVGRRCKT